MSRRGRWDGTFGDILYIAFIAKTSILSYVLKKGNCAKCQFGGGCSSLTMVDVPRGRLMGNNRRGGSTLTRDYEKGDVMRISGLVVSREERRLVV